MLAPYVIEPDLLFALEGSAERAARRRDLRAEAADLDACAGAALDTLIICYPPLDFGPAGSVPIIGN